LQREIYIFCAIFTLHKRRKMGHFIIGEGGERMITIFIRTLLIYAMVTGAMRLMGKRQIGQLEVSELITTLLLSEIATLPIENPDVPVLHAVIPIVTLLTLEVCMALLLSHRPKLRQKLEAPPSMLIRGGKLDQKELFRNRLSVDELFAGLRQQGVGDPTEVQYAILEKNGQLSVILKEQYRPATAGDVLSSVERTGMMHLIVSDGAINEYNMKLLGRNDGWLAGVLRKERVKQAEVLYLLCNDAGQTALVKKEKGT
jgi:uncharacterized membrane protein YcaP (DUF421 family)